MKTKIIVATAILGITGIGALVYAGTDKDENKQKVAMNRRMPKVCRNRTAIPNIIGPDFQLAPSLFSITRMYLVIKKRFQPLSWT
jgi:hypothetical protein